MSNLPTRTTTKKVKYKGVQSFINASTGEVQEFAVTDIEDRDFNFGKVWMKNFIATLELVGNQKTKVCYWIIDHLTKENEITLTYRQIADEMHVSYQTVAYTLKILQESDFLRKVGKVYRVNPDVYFKGSHNARMGLLQEWHSMPKKVLTAAEKIKNIDMSIEALQKQKDDLLKEQGVIDLEVDDQLSFNQQGDIIETAKPTKRKPKKGGN